MEEEISDEELAEKIAQLATTTPIPEEKHNVHTFLNNVAVSEDTTKTGYLRDDKDINELGVPRLPLRTLKELGLFCNKIANMQYFADYFLQRGEILTATSLSRNAKLIELAVIQRRELSATTKLPRKENKGWFRKRTTDQEETG